MKNFFLVMLIAVLPIACAQQRGSSSPTVITGAGADDLRRAYELDGKADATKPAGGARGALVDSGHTQVHLVAGASTPGKPTNRVHWRMRIVTEDGSPLDRVDLRRNENRTDYFQQLAPNDIAIEFTTHTARDEFLARVRKGTPLLIGVVMTEQGTGNPNPKTFYYRAKAVEGDFGTTMHFRNGSEADKAIFQAFLNGQPY